MESVINFLADYYIWFFVAAGVLCFALVGFIIESKKKDKNTFKGESISTNEQPVPSTPVENAVPTETASVTNEPQPELAEPVQPTPAEPISAHLETPETPENAVTEDTMEINDIPLKEEEKTPIEFYSESTGINNNEVTPISKTPNEQPAVEMINENTNTQPQQSENIETLNIFDDIK